jgi:hypothetical protein
MLLLCCFKNTEAQKPEFLLPLYFSDSKGNKDTVYTGYDINAEYGFWEGDFGEKDIRYEPFEKAMDARTGALVIKTNPKLPFMSKIYVQKRSCYISTPDLAKGVNTQTFLYFLSKNFPINISWDTTLIDKNCVHNSFFHRNPAARLENKFVKERIYLRDSHGKITITKSLLNSVSSSFAGDILLPSGDTVICMNLFLLDKNKSAYETTAINDIREDTNTITISPNPAYTIINIKIENEERRVKKLEIIDATGSIISTNINSFLENKNDFDIDIGLFSSGLYFVKISFDNGSIGFKRFLKL